MFCLRAGHALAGASVHNKKSEFCRVTCRVHAGREEAGGEQCLLTVADCLRATPVSEEEASEQTAWPRVRQVRTYGESPLGMCAALTHPGVLGCVR